MSSSEGRWEPDWHLNRDRELFWSRFIHESELESFSEKLVRRLRENIDHQGLVVDPDAGEESPLG